MKFMSFLMIAFAMTSVAHAESDSSARYRGDCSGDFDCSATQVIEPQRQAQPPISQPAGIPTKGACGMLPQLFKVQSLGAACGNATVGGSRFPERVSPDTRDMWDRYLTAGLPEQAQEIRRNDTIGWQGKVNVPVTETYQWTEMVGDYSNPRFCYPGNPTESLASTCVIEREEVYYTNDDETDYDNCLERRADPPPSSPSSYDGGGSSYHGGGSGGSSSPSINSGPSRGGGENRSSMKDDYGFIDYKPVDRFPAGECLRYGSKTVRHRRTRSASPVQYTCYRDYNRYCVHPVVRTETRSCQPQAVVYQARYVHTDKKGVEVWKPGYVDAKLPYRNYNNLIPNRFDLLLGEDEHMNLSLNDGSQDGRLTPSFKVQSLWNKYEYSINPKSRLQCGDGTNPIVAINIHTLGRIKRKMPNALVVPTVKKNGKDESVAFTYEQEKLKNGKTENGRPALLTLDETSRGVMLDASLQSRIYGRSEGKNHTENGVAPDKVSTAANGGFWVDTQYRMQLFKKDKWGRWIRITRPTKANQNQVQYVDNTVSINLLGKTAVKEFYRPSGAIFEPILGHVYDAFGVALTPGDNYYVKVQMVTRGLPWYDQGCKGGKAECEGEEATSNAYSEPVVVKFTASKNIDHRSLMQKVIDFQEWLSPF